MCESVCCVGGNVFIYYGENASLFSGDGDRAFYPGIPMYRREALGIMVCHPEEIVVILGGKKKQSGNLTATRGWTTSLLYYFKDRTIKFNKFSSEV